MAYFGRILRNYADHSFGTITEYGRQLTGIPRAKHAFVVEFYTTKNTGNSTSSSLKYMSINYRV